jgi:hypothetical protein
MEGIAATMRHYSRSHLIFQNNLAELWKDAHSAVIVYGTSSEEVIYQKSIALHDWFFGVELSESIIVVIGNAVHILTSQKKGTRAFLTVSSCSSWPFLMFASCRSWPFLMLCSVKILEALQKSPKRGDITINLVTRKKEDKDAAGIASLVEQVTYSLRKQMNLCSRLSVLDQGRWP